MARCPFVQLDFRFSRHFSKYYKNYDANTKCNMYSNHSPPNPHWTQVNRTLVIWVHICDWFVSNERLPDLTFDIVVDLKVSILGLLLGLFWSLKHATFGTCSIWFFHRVSCLIIKKINLKTWNVTKSLAKPATVKQFKLLIWRLHIWKNLKFQNFQNDKND